MFALGLLMLLLMCAGCSTSHALEAQWKSCSGSSAAFDIQAVDLNPEVVPQGGSLSLVASIINKQPAVTAGSATVKVYYYGWWVLTASGTICEAPPATTQAATSSMSTAHRRLLWDRSSSSSSLSSISMWPTSWSTSSSSSSGGDSRKSWSDSSWLSSSAQPIRHLSGQDSAHAAASRSWRPMRDDTCVLPGGPLQLHHQASLPALAPRGNYRMQLSAADPITAQELFCLDVWFKVSG